MNYTKLVALCDRALMCITCNCACNVTVMLGITSLFCEKCFSYTYWGFFYFYFFYPAMLRYILMIRYQICLDCHPKWYLLTAVYKNNVSASVNIVIMSTLSTWDADWLYVSEEIPTQSEISLSRGNWGGYSFIPLFIRNYKSNLIFDVSVMLHFFPSILPWNNICSMTAKISNCPITLNFCGVKELSRWL